MSQKLKSVMVLKGYNQKSLAETIGMFESVLSLKLNGKRDWKESDISIICEKLNLCPCEIFFDGKFPKSQHKCELLTKEERQ